MEVQWYALAAFCLVQEIKKLKLNKNIIVKLLLIAFLLAALTGCQKDVVPNVPNNPPPATGEDTTKLINYVKDLTIANWNIEWFGNAAMFKDNLDVQENNAGKILKFLNADLYGVCEIVDTARFGRMIRNHLNSEYRYSISYYPTISGSQKLAFIYNRNIFRKVTVRPFMGLSSSAYFNFAQRFPFLLNADVVVNSKRFNMNFILLHAKANADADGYNRRLNGAVELKDSLDKNFSSSYFMMLGDFNDNFLGSINSGKVSPYQNFMDDAKYNAITKPLNVNGYQSTISYVNSVIDQQMISSNITGWYQTGSVRIRTDVKSIIPDYDSGNTSDHYPVTSVYSVR